MSSVPRRTVTKRTSPVPRGARRREQLLKVAEQTFFEGGFNDVTMQALATKAGASKETLYRYFRSKDDLLTEVVTNRIKRLVKPLTTALDREGPINLVLNEFGSELLRLMMDRDVVALLRTVVAETPRRPALGRIFFDVGPEQTRQSLTAFLTEAQAGGTLRKFDARLAATIFLGGVMSYAHAAGLVLVDLPPLTSDEVEERVKEVVSMFLDHYRVI